MLLKKRELAFRSQESGVQGLGTGAATPSPGPPLADHPLPHGGEGWSERIGSSSHEPGPAQSAQVPTPHVQGGCGRSPGSGDRIRWVGPVSPRPKPFGRRLSAPTWPNAIRPYSDEQRHFLAAGIQLRVCGFGRIAARQEGNRQTPQQQQSGMAASPIEPAYPALRPDSLSARLSFAHRVLDASHTFYRQFLGGNDR